MGSNVDHPSHYNREGAMECIDEMIEVFGEEAVKHFCLCNAWKYRYRASDKNGIEDLKKSDWYMNKYKELNKESNTTYHSIPAGYSPWTYEPLKWDPKWTPPYEITCNTAQVKRD